MNSDTEATLITETQRWHHKLKEKLEAAVPQTKEGEEILVNVKAYDKDASHFRSKEDYVRSFEAVIWAWAYLDIGLKFGMLKTK